MAHKEPTEMRVLISACRLSQFDYWFCLSVLTFFSLKWYLYDSCSSYLYNKLLVEIFFWTCCFVQLVLEIELCSEGPTNLWFSSDVRSNSELQLWSLPSWEYLGIGNMVLYKISGSTLFRCKQFHEIIRLEQIL